MKHQDAPDCRDCRGHGRRWLASHMTDPSARERWETCERCDGSGEEPQPEQEDEEEEPASACHTPPR